MKPLYLGRHRSPDNTSEIRPWETCVQICLTASHRWSINCQWDDQSLKKLASHCRLFVHGKFIYNFCRPQIVDQQTILLKELTMAQRLGADLVIHQGKNLPQLHCDRLQALECYARQINQVLKEFCSQPGPPTKLLLENSAHQGTEIGHQLSELACIWDLLDPKLRRRAGICIDTCHIFAAGELDLRDDKKVCEWLKKFDQLIGLENMSLVHLNDSMKPLGCRVDRHQDLFQGYITNPQLGGSTKGLAYLIQVCRQRAIPIIMETPGSNWEECARWIKELE